MVDVYSVTDGDKMEMQVRSLCCISIHKRGLVQYGNSGLEFVVFQEAGCTVCELLVQFALLASCVSILIHIVR
jgi:hypothetical protein